MRIFASRQPAMGRTALLSVGLTLVVVAAPRSVAAQPAFAKRPYLMDVAEDRVAVLFELDAEAPATVVVEREGEAPRVAASPPSRFHEVLIEGLDPETAYAYRVLPGTAPSDAGVPSAGDDAAVARGSFHTAPPPGEGPIRFLVMGDNRTDAVAHAAVVHAMRERAGEADFVINTGDMVANGSEEEDWIEMFDVQAPLLADLPLFPTLGNHELYARGHGLPSYLKYTRVPRELGGAETYYAFTYGPVRFLVLDSNDDWDDPNAAQRAWLSEQLLAAESDAAVRHVMVAMHHGPLSSGRHGSHPALASTGVLDLFRDRGVSLVFSGHDHAYERGEAISVKYIVTGGGGAPLYDVNEPLPYQHAFAATHHFLEVAVDGDDVEVVTYLPDGSILEDCGFTGRERWHCERSLPAAEPSPREPVGGSARWVLLVAALAILATVGVVLVRRRRA